ncbi:MAG: glutathione S-transferase family protein [Deltaproteobacteria bacterium]|nr:glutathione S-transferase family protein [Deltaproteobacteria bacterium]
MAELILHHYDTSPFSEKVKKILAHKRLAWRAVEQPTIMPKPHLIPLTGGYRRIPVLQIGADIFCDSQLIARVLEAHQPEPTIYPGGTQAACHAMALWADRTFFMASVPVLFALIGDAVPQAFIDDRSKLMGGGPISFADVPKQAAAAREQLRACAALVDAQLADGRRFLFGDAFSLADAASYHPVWFLRNFPGAGVIFDEYGALLGWAERIQAMGHGQRRDMSPDEALAVARDSQPATASGVDAHEPNGLRTGARVTVTPDDYGFDPVAGELVGSSAHEIALRRHAPEVGEVVVHFPRIGFRVSPV